MFFTKKDRKEIEEINESLTELADILGYERVINGVEMKEEAVLKYKWQKKQPSVVVFPGMIPQKRKPGRLKGSKKK